MASFGHYPLASNTKYIRLLRFLPKAHDLSSEDSVIEPNQQNDYVSCTIFHVSLDDAPTYTALSYCWGNSIKTRAIYANGTTAMVTENLEIALRHIRLQDQHVTLWIDALCIDQENDREKSDQVQLMKQIYSNADIVLVWLGPAGENSNLAMQWISRFGGLSYELGIGTKNELQLRRLLERYENEDTGISNRLCEFIQDLQEQLSPAHRGYGELIPALSRLLERAYWSRVWVVQECALASVVQFVCGIKKVEENTLHHALRLLRNFRLYRLLKSEQGNGLKSIENDPIVPLNPSWPISLLKTRRAPQPFQFVYLMRTLRHFEATDPRDRVFAYMGITYDGRSLGLSSDYHKSCEEVYKDLARALLQNGYIEVLSFCEFHKQVANLPSWVPDWSCITRRSPLQERALDRSTKPLVSRLQPKFSASGADQDAGDHVSIYTVNRNMELLLSAAYIGEVSCVGAIWEHAGVGQWLKELQRLSNLTAGAYGEGDGRAAAVWRTAVADQDIRRGNDKPRLSEKIIQKVHEILQEKELDLIDPQVLIAASLGNYNYQMQAIAEGRRPLLASNRYIGIGPCEMEAGDLIFVIHGANVPHICRGRDGDKNLQFIGEAYIHGIMDGEAINGGSEMQTISIY